MAGEFSTRNLERRLAAIPRAVKDAAKPALERNASTLASTMRRLAESSRDTGALINSIAVTPGGQTTPPYSQPGGSSTVPENAVAITVGNKDVRYGHLVEYGTSKAHAQPFFWPAVRLNAKKIKRSIKRAVGKAVREVK